MGYARGKASKARKQPPAKGVSSGPMMNASHSNRLSSARAKGRDEIPRRDGFGGWAGDRATGPSGGRSGDRAGGRPALRSRRTVVARIHAGAIAPVIGPAARPSGGFAPISDHSFASRFIAIIELVAPPRGLTRAAQPTARARVHAHGRAGEPL